MQSELKAQTEPRRWPRWGLLVLVLGSTAPVKSLCLLFCLFGCAERGLSLVVAGGLLSGCRFSLRRLLSSWSGALGSAG